jgi:hypothetical protein
MKCLLGFEETGTLFTPLVGMYNHYGKQHRASSITKNLK